MNVVLSNATRFAGPALAARLVAKGHTVLASDAAFADAQAASDFAAKGAGAGTLLILATDKPDRIAQHAREALKGRVNAVICNDYFPAIRAPLGDAKLDDLRAAMEALVVAPYALLQALLPEIKASTGRVVIISSASPLRGLANYSAYCIARGAQNSMVVTLAKELAPFGIPVNAVAANYIKTPAYFPDSLTSNPEAMKKMLANVPLKRLGSADELAAAGEFFAVGDCGFTTGSILPVAGGFGSL